MHAYKHMHSSETAASQTGRWLSLCVRCALVAFNQSYSDTKKGAHSLSRIPTLLVREEVNICRYWQREWLEENKILESRRDSSAIRSTCWSSEDQSLDPRTPSKHNSSPRRSDTRLAFPHPSWPHTHCTSVSISRSDSSSQAVQARDDL